MQGSKWARLARLSQARRDRPIAIRAVVVDDTRMVETKVRQVVERPEPQGTRVVAGNGLSVGLRHEHHAGGWSPRIAEGV